MRTVLITTALFIALCIIMVMNYNYVSGAAHELFLLAESLDYSEKEACHATIVQMEELWQKSSRLIALSANLREIDYLGETLLSLRSSFETESEKDFERYRVLLIDAIEGVAQLEKIP